MSYTDNYLNEKIEKVTELMKDESDAKIMKEFGGLRAKRYGYLAYDKDKDKKAKDTRKQVIKRKIKFED